MCHGARQYGGFFRTPHLQLLPPCASGGVDGGASPAAPRCLPLTLTLTLPLTSAPTPNPNPNPIQARHLPPLEAYAAVREAMERRIFEEHLPCTPDGQARYTPVPPWLQPLTSLAAPPYLPTLATHPYLPSYSPLPRLASAPQASPFAAAKMRDRMRGNLYPFVPLSEDQTRLAFELQLQA